MPSFPPVKRCVHTVIKSHLTLASLIRASRVAFPLVGEELSLRKQLTFRDVTTAGFPLPGNDVRERAQKFYTMTRHYQDLSSTSDWLKICFNQSKYYTTQIWIVTKIKSIPGGTRSSFHYEGVHVQPYGLKYLAQNSGFLQSLEFLKKSLSNFPDLKIFFKATTTSAL